MLLDFCVIEKYIDSGCVCILVLELWKLYHPPLMDITTIHNYEQKSLGPHGQLIAYYKRVTIKCTYFVEGSNWDLFNSTKSISTGIWFNSNKLLSFDLQSKNSFNIFHIITDIASTSSITRCGSENFEFLENHILVKYMTNKSLS